jgi:hypothetical protein
MSANLYDYLYLAVVVFGVLGNGAAFVVCSRLNLQKTVFSTYFRFLVLVDTFTLIFNPLYFFIANFTDFDVLAISTDFCRLNGILYYMTATSGWIEAAISIDRLININFPNRFLFFKKRWFQFSVCFALLIKDFVVYSQNYFETSLLIYENFSNDSQNSSFEAFCFMDLAALHILDWINFFNSTLLPFVLMATCTLLIVKHLIQSRKSANSTRNQRKKRDRKFATNSVAINLIFFLTNLPLAFFKLYFNYFNTTISYQIANNLIQFFYFCKYIHFGSVFYINIWVNSVFRQEFMSLIRCKSSLNSANSTRTGTNLH